MTKECPIVTVAPERVTFLFESLDVLLAGTENSNKRSDLM